MEVRGDSEDIPSVLVHGSLATAAEEWEAQMPLAALGGQPAAGLVAAAAYPNLIVSGGHHDGFEAMCDDLAGRIGARRLVVAGAGHEVQFTGGPLNAALLDRWRLPSGGPASRRSV